jgi:hypothetical protein
VSAPAPISVVMCIAYDWLRAVRAIASVWSIAREVLVSWDRRGLTWDGQTFKAPDEWTLLDRLRDRIGIAYSEGRQKLRLFPGDFWSLGRGRQELQIAQRLAVSQLAAPGGWQLTLDADEVLVDPGNFARQVPRPAPGLGLLVEFRSVYKVIGETALVFDSRRAFPIAQAEPGVFIHGPSRAQQWIQTPGLVVHHHMDRTEDELRMKLGALTPTTWSVDDVVMPWKETTLANFREPRSRPGTCYAPDTPLRAVPVAMLYAPPEAQP